MSGDLQDELPEGSAPSGTWRQRAFQVFTRPSYRTYFFGLLSTMLGFWVRIAAVGWLVYEITGRKDRLGEVAAASLLPWVIVSPLAGVWADRVDPRRMIIAALIGVCAANVILVWLLTEGLATYPVIIGWCIVAGSFRGLENPARHAFVRALVPRAELPSAIGMNAAAFHLMGALGFALEGWLYEGFGPRGCFIAVALLTLPMLLQLHRLRHLRVAPSTEDRVGGWASLREGFAHVAHHSALRPLLLSSFALVVLVLCWRTVMPAVAKDGLGLAEAGYGKLMSMAGWGALVGALWSAGAPESLPGRVRRMVLLGAVALASIAWIATSSTVAACGVGVFAAGLCQVGFMATANSTLQLIIPDGMRGRVMGLWALMFGAGFPLGSWVVGILSQRYGTRAALLGMTGAGVVTLFVIVARLWLKSQRVRATA